MPGDGTQTGYGDELKLQGVAGRGEAVGVFLEDGHPQGHGDGLQAKSVVEPPAGMAGVAAGLVDDLRHSVQVDVLPGDRSETGYRSVVCSCSESVLDLTTYQCQRKLKINTFEKLEKANRPL